MSFVVWNIEEEEEYVFFVFFVGFGICNVFGLGFFLEVKRGYVLGCFWIIGKLVVGYGYIFGDYECYVLICLF